MSLRIEQDFKYQGSDWWKWSVWIEGTEKELDEIVYAEYKLHPTFPQPIRRIEDRASNFKLNAHGWGMFPIKVKLVKKNGEVVILTHQLVLRYEDGQATTL
jgi:transcription initiation factor IIF auxiliary subunit